MRRLSMLTAATTMLVLAAVPAWGCGFLVAANGAVRLVRSAALAAYVDGVEHYVTSFEFAGPESSFGSIVPLPGEPTVVERAGSWTLQRLALETQPSLQAVADDAAGADAARGVEVLMEVAIDDLDLTVLRGGGEAVLGWARDNGFDLDDDAGPMLEFYAERSPYFMAARFDLAEGESFERSVGDGIPVHVAIPTDDPWVPLRILGYAKPDGEVVEADVYLLTEHRPTLLPGDRPGLEVRHSAPATTALLNDLRSDENSAWVPESAWLTYVRLGVPAGELTYDLAVSSTGGTPDPVAAFGRAAVAALADAESRPAEPRRSDVPLVLLAAVSAGAGLTYLRHASRRSRQRRGEQ